MALPKGEADHAKVASDEGEFRDGEIHGIISLESLEGVIDIDDGFDWINEGHGSNHDRKNIDVGAGHPHHEALHKNIFAGCQSYVEGPPLHHLCLNFKRVGA